MKKQKLLERIARALEASILDAPKSVDWRCHYAAAWQVDKGQSYLTPILADSPVTLDDLVGIETQRQRVENNTRQFLNYFPANNVLMWGTRGTGKSSLVRALLHHYADQGLRLIQVDREDYHARKARRTASMIALLLFDIRTTKPYGLITSHGTSGRKPPPRGHTIV